MFTAQYLVYLSLVFFASFAIAWSAAVVIVFTRLTLHPLESTYKSLRHYYKIVGMSFAH